MEHCGQSLVTKCLSRHHLHPLITSQTERSAFLICPIVLSVPCLMACYRQSNHTSNNSSVHARPDGRWNKSARAPTSHSPLIGAFVMHQGSGTHVHRRGGIPGPTYADLVRRYNRVANASDCQRYFQPGRTGVRCLPYRSRPPCWRERYTRAPLPHIRDRKGPTTHTVDCRINPLMATYPSTPSSRK